MALVKAAVCHEFGKPLSIEDVELRAPISGEVEVTLAAVAICHSDISYADGAWGGSLPLGKKTEKRMLSFPRQLVPNSDSSVCTIL